MGGYTKSELYGFWKLFKDQRDAASVLMDFALCDRATAKELLSDFEVRYAAEGLGIERRGKEE